MSNQRSRNRKLAYAGGIAALLIPIVVLGMPAGNRGQEGFSGILAQIRADPDHQLGETTLGDVDPASATMTFVLLGFRGLAANQLWMQADEHKQRKQWAELDSTVESITKLQPHFKKVWEFHGWNLAWNVSAEWDGVEDRYFWVKKGGKFLVKGTRRSSRYPELYWEVGRVVGFKIGRSDEWRQFRRFFLSDPDPEFNGGQDPEIAGIGDALARDNYLAARHWYYRANEQDRSVNQRMMATELFRSYPARSQFDYGGALHREGKFTDEAQQAWKDAEFLWLEEFGQEEFNSLRGGWIVINPSSDEQLQALTDKDDRIFPLEAKRKAVESKRKLTNFDYWAAKASSEKTENTKLAHQLIYAGRQLFHAGLTTPTTTFAVADADVCEKLDELEGLTDGQRKVLAAACEAGVVWYTTDPDAPELSEERRVKLKFAKSKLEVAVEADGPVVLTGDLAETLETTPDDLFADLLVLREAGHLVARSECEVVLRAGMVRYEDVLKSVKRLEEDTLSVEEGLMSVIYLRKLYDQDELPFPTEYPLKRYWDAEWNADALHGRISEVERMYYRDQPTIEY